MVAFWYGVTVELVYYHRFEALAPVPGRDAQDHQPELVHDPPAVQVSQQPGGEKSAPRLFEHLIYVRQAEAEPRDFALQFDENNKFRINDELQLGGEPVELRLGVLDKAPVLDPTLVVEPFE